MKTPVVTPKNARSVAVGAAMQAGRILSEYAGKTIRIDAKQHHDFVTEVDQRSEEAIIQYIRRAFPGHDILAEESGADPKGGDYRWIIDPLDGTTNFIHGMPMYAVSIALEVAGDLTVAVVYEPVRRELFVAEKGRGAYLNDRRLSVSRTSTLSRCLLATGFPFRDFSLVDDYLKSFRYFMSHVSGIRRAGSAALDLCYLACGRFDGFWELNLKPWDMAAGVLIIREAGGLVTSPSGGTDFLYRGNIVGSNGLIHPWMLEAFRELIGEKVKTW